MSGRGVEEGSKSLSRQFSKHKLAPCYNRVRLTGDCVPWFVESPLKRDGFGVPADVTRPQAVRVKVSRYSIKMGYVSQSGSFGAMVLLRPSFLE